jgi:EAL domain-containing protein (putative c-di-GMP-specific phosphodiesterase class I)
VETQDQQTFLEDVGCDVMQGFHFVRPMPGNELPDWLASHQPAQVRDVVTL